MDDELLDYYSILKKNWLLILIVFAGLFTLSLVYTFNVDPTYKSTSMVVVEGTAPSNFFSTQTVRVDMETQVQTILSSSVLGKVQDYYLEDYDVKVSNIKNSNVIQIDVESKNRRMTHTVADAIAEEYVNYTILAKQQNAIEISSFIDEQINQYQAEITKLNLDLLVSKQKVPRTNAEELQYQEIVQELDAKEKLYSYLLSKREEVGIIAQESSSNVQIIQYAQIPIFPIKPNFVSNILLGLILSAIIAVGIAFVKEYIKNTFRNLREIESELSLGILGTLEYIKDATYDLLSHEKSSVVESLHMMRTNLQFYSKDNNVKLIGVVAAEEGDGATTVCYNLAKSFSKQKHKVLLIDANMRTSMLETITKPQVKPDKGLSNVILGDVELKDAIYRKKDMDILYAGSFNINPSELFNSHKMQAICTVLKKSRYDLILFDCPSTQYSESLILAKELEGLLLVVALDKTDRDLALKSKSILEKVGGKLIGVAANRVR